MYFEEVNNERETPEPEPAKASNKNGLNYSANILSITHGRTANVRNMTTMAEHLEVTNSYVHCKEVAATTEKKDKTEQETHGITEDTYHHKDSRALHFKEKMGGWMDG